jgi:hypothetical protein
MPPCSSTSFAELNFEQQAELLERAWAAGWFADAPDAGAETRRLLVRLIDARRDDGFAVRLATVADGTGATMGGWLDATPALLDGLARVRVAARPRGRNADGAQPP